MAKDQGYAPVVTADANDRLAKMKAAQANQAAQYQRKRTNLLGEKKGPGTSSVLGAGGAMTLAQMKLDREEHLGEEYDPLNPTQMRKTNQDQLQLKGQKHVMDRTNTIG